MWRLNFLSMDFSVSHLDFTSSVVPGSPRPRLSCPGWSITANCPLSLLLAVLQSARPDLDQDFQLSSCHTETNNGSTLTPTNIYHGDPVRRSVRISIIYVLMSPKWMDYIIYQLVSFTQSNWLKNAISESRFFTLNKYKLNVYRICAMRLDLNNYYHPVSNSRYEAF